MRENSPGGRPVMPMKRYKPEQIVNLLREIEVEIANGKTTPQASKETEITQQTYYRWRKEYGGLKLDQAKRLVAELLGPHRVVLHSPLLDHRRGAVRHACR